MARFDRFCSAAAVSYDGKAFVVTYMTDGEEAVPAGGSARSSIEVALSQVASDLAEAVAALRDQASRLWAPGPAPDEPSNAS